MRLSVCLLGIALSGCQVGGTGNVSHIAQVKVVAVRRGPVKIQDMQGGEPVKMPGPYYVVDIEIRNPTADRKIDYQPWSGGPLGQSMATLQDDMGNTYQQIDFGLGIKATGQVAEGRSVYPGDTLTDRLVFQPPVSHAKTMRLTLPGANLGESDDWVFRLDR